MTATNMIGLEQVVTNCHVLARASAVTVSRGNVTYGAALEYPDPERDLCQLLGVSRTAVREALARLEQAGLTRTRHGGQTTARDYLADGGLDQPGLRRLAPRQLTQNSADASA